MDPLEVFAAYPDDCRPMAIESLGAAGGFSGAEFWRVSAACGRLCLRRWPQEHPSAEGLEFIQAVLWHVTREGFSLVPLPKETRGHAGYVRHGGYLWQLEPWMPGKADYRAHPSLEKLQAAVVALAEFHLAAATFPLPHAPLSPSPGIQARRRELCRWLAGDLAELSHAVAPDVCPELASQAARICSLVPVRARDVFARLERCAGHRVALQPCIRDIWHAHVLFDGSRVRGLVDFGSMRAENVAADLARLLGSMAGVDAGLWQLGLAAYRARRPLSDAELALVDAFDRSSVLMSGLHWVDWIYRERRTFANYAAIAGRMDEILDRLERLA